MAVLKLHNLKLLALFLIFVFTTCEIRNDYDPSKIITQFSDDLAKYFIHFAGYGYCTLEEMVNSKCCQEIIDTDGWNLHAYGKVVQDDYNFAILKHEQFKKVVIAFPGTRGKIQLLFEFIKSTATSFSESDTERVPGYFNTMYQSIKDLVDDPLKKLYLTHIDYQFVFTGHSLGASMAAILALDSVKYGSLIKTDSSPVLITYGMPRTGNDIFANELMANIPQVYRVVRQGDIVATLPLCYYGFFEKDCRTNLPEGKFDSKFKVNSTQINAEMHNFYGWHVGGLKLYDKDMETYEDCGNEISENFKNPECVNTYSISLRRHDTYFGQNVHHMCSKS